MIVIEPFRGKSVAGQSVEIVERKGTGHPDYICDSIMDSISVALSGIYLKEFGSVLHHNIDKALLAAGKTVKRFGGGRVIRPMELIIGDRATFRADKKKIPVADIAVETAKSWLGRNLRFVDPVRDVKYRVVLAEGSEELTDIFSREGKTRGANDTSAAVGYYPLSPTEQAVLGLERYLNSKPFKKRFPQTGEDIKVMGMRKGTDLEMIVAMPLMCRAIASEADYFSCKGRVNDEMKNFLDKFSNAGFKKIDVRYNTLDEKGRGLGGVYLSLSGTSAEDADSGQVGRGNRVNGLISMNRPMGTEAAAGKNPVSHVGKIYNVLAHRAARRIYESCEGAREVYVLLLSSIGAPVDSPRMACAQILLERGMKIKDVAAIAGGALEDELRDINRLCLDLAKGKYPVC